MSTKQIKAPKVDVLEFIMRRGVVQVYELQDKFHYSYWGAKNRLRRLKKEGLVINMTRGSWELTEEGYKRLKYYGKR